MTTRSLQFLLIAIIVFLVVPPRLRAQDENQAALVVSFGDGTIESRCVSFSETEITGFELLERSGLNPEIDVANLGAQVCRISGTGCPPDDCWCNCRGGGSDCIYWSYWHRLGDVWQYSQVGAATYRITNGAVDGWAYGLGAPNEAEPPPSLTFEDVCAPEVEPPTETPVTPSPTAALIATPEPTVTPGDPVPSATGTAMPSPTSSPTATVLPTTPSPSPSATAAEQETGGDENPTVTASPQPTRPLPNVPTPTRFRFPTMTPTSDGIAVTINAPSPAAPLATNTPQSFEAGNLPLGPSPTAANRSGSAAFVPATPISTLPANAEAIGGRPGEAATRQAEQAAASRTTLLRRLVAVAGYFVFAAIVLILLGMLIIVQWRRQSS